MAEITVDRRALFPTGTALGVYEPGSFLPDPEIGPLAAALQSKVVDEEEGVVGVKFTGLTDNRRYVIAGKVGGVWRKVQVVVGKLGTSLNPPKRYSTHPAG